MFIKAQQIVPHLHLQLKFETSVTEAHSLASGGFGSDRGQNETGLRIVKTPGGFVWCDGPFYLVK